MSSETRGSVQELPDLMDRIHNMGLSEEYQAYRERYLGWRRGGAEGVSGELNAVSLEEKKGGWGYWYPTIQEWQWKRTLSYWISVTFFEGSLFFTLSSFLACYSGHLGHIRSALTTWGYAAGKVHYFACTYLMCVETINMTNADDDGSQGKRRQIRKLNGEPETDPEETESSDASSTAEDECRDGSTRKFYYWPFHWRTALSNLKRLGVGPWPYLASVAYFIGVWVFAIGLICELGGFFPEQVTYWVIFWTFLVGSICFTAGGIFECIENGVFTTLKLDQGYCGAVLNTVGGALFLGGSLMGYSEDLAFEANFAFGVGSLLFAFGSAVMILMWKDEQFGLTFLAVLNNLGGANGRPLLERPGEPNEKNNTFSRRGAVFIMIYCMTGTVSVYDFLCVLYDDTYQDTKDASYLRTVERAFNALLPCIFAHMMLALNAGVYKTPRIAPFHQLYVACRWIAAIMVMNSSARVIEAISIASREHATE